MAANPPVTNPIVMLIVNKVPKQFSGMVPVLMSRIDPDFLDWLHQRVSMAIGGLLTADYESVGRVFSNVIADLNVNDVDLYDFCDQTTRDMIDRVNAESAARHV